MLVNIDPIEPGDQASPNLWNDRFGAITAALNGNIDSDNLKDGGITTSKLAPESVTSDKIATDRYVDTNGWTVNDLGTFKMYSKTVTASNITLTQGQRWAIGHIEPPVGRTRDNLFILATWFGGYAGHVITGIEAGNAAQIQVIIAHNWPSTLTFNGVVHVIAIEKV